MDIWNLEREVLLNKRVVKKEKSLSWRLKLWCLLWTALGPTSLVQRERVRFSSSSSFFFFFIQNNNLITHFFLFTIQHSNYQSITTRLDQVRRLHLYRLNLRPPYYENNNNINKIQSANGRHSIWTFYVIHILDFISSRNTLRKIWFTNTLVTYNCILKIKHQQ